MAASRPYTSHCEKVVWARHDHPSPEPAVEMMAGTHYFQRGWAYRLSRRLSGSSPGAPVFNAETGMTAAISLVSAHAAINEENVIVGSKAIACARMATVGMEKKLRLTHSMPMENKL